MFTIVVVAVVVVSVVDVPVVVLLCCCRCRPHRWRCDASQGFLRDFDSDETTMVALGSAGTSIAGRTLKAKPKKIVDLPTLRTQCASRVLTQVRFVKAALSDADGKCSIYLKDAKEAHDAFIVMCEKGVPECDVLNKRWDLGDLGGLVKNFYALTRRSLMCELINLEAVDEKNTSELSQLLASDEFLKEHAATATFISELENPSHKLDNALTQEAVLAMRDELLKACGSCKTVCAALRRSVKDGGSIKTQIDKAHKVFETKKQAAAEGKTGTLQGRPNLKTICDKDAVIIQGFRGLAITRPMITVKDCQVDESKVPVAPQYPMIIRQGKNVLKQLTKNATTKKAVEEAMTEFKDQCKIAPDEKSLFGTYYYNVR
jgi:hypothetical protein